MFSGVPPPTVIRVERQCSRHAVPKQLATLGALFEHGADLNPFPNLEFAKTEVKSVSTAGWPPQKWLMSQGLATAVQEQGRAAVRARLNQSGNANRVFRQYSGLLSTESPGVTDEQLRNIYRSGTIKQLNLPSTDSDGEVSYPSWWKAASAVTPDTTRQFDEN
jgi:hypothetical protein